MVQPRMKGETDKSKIILTVGLVINSDAECARLLTLEQKRTNMEVNKNTIS